MNRATVTLYPPLSAWAEVDLKAVRHNFRAVKKCAGRRTNILSVVKADGYGHGMVEVSRLLEKEGTDFFGVANIREGIILRKNGFKKPVLVFENVLPTFAPFMADYNLTATVCTRELALALDHWAQKKRKKIAIHVKIDTGMGRLGIWHEDALSFIVWINQLKGLFLEGIYTHFPSADTDKAYTKRQIEAFAGFAKQVKSCGINIPFVHAANSAGLVDYKERLFNLVRPGLMLYGMYPNPRFRAKINLEPALSVKSRIMFIKDIVKGRSISYGRTFTASSSMTIATLPIGYNDGYFRLFSNNAEVLVKGERCRVLGRVTMDLTVIDVSHVLDAEVGDEAVLLGVQGEEYIDADELAALSGTINYEITCSLGNRLPRKYLS